MESVVWAWNVNNNIVFKIVTTSRMTYFALQLFINTQPNWNKQRTLRILAMSFCFSWNYILQHATRSAVLRNLIHDEYFKGKKLYRVRADLMRKRQKAHRVIKKKHQEKLRIILKKWSKIAWCSTPQKPPEWGTKTVLTSLCNKKKVKTFNVNLKV